MNKYHQIIDANINRIAEGLRVIEDYVRFVSKQKDLTDQLAKLRKKINESEVDMIKHLLVRDTTKDMRTGEKPRPRQHTVDLLKANFKRVQEGLRVLEEYTKNPLYNTIRYQMYDIEKEIILTALKKPLTPGVYLISDDINILEQGIKWGVSAIQLRDKKSPKQQIFKKALTLKEKATKAGIPLIINDYLDIALLSDADGFHSGQDDLDIHLIRELLGPHKLIGRSTSTLPEGLEAQKQGADYIGIGPIWSTVSKPERKPIGLEYIEEAKEKITIPYVAIGDVTLSHMEAFDGFLPPLVALIRAYKDIPTIQKKYYSG